MRFDRFAHLLTVLLLAGCTINIPSNAPPVPPPPGPPSVDPHVPPDVLPSAISPARGDVASALSAYRRDLSDAWRFVAKAKPATVAEASALAAPLTDNAHEKLHQRIGEIFRRELGDGELDAAKLAKFEEFARGAEMSIVIVRSPDEPRGPPASPDRKEKSILVPREAAGQEHEPEFFPEPTDLNSCP